MLILQQWEHFLGFYYMHFRSTVKQTHPAFSAGYVAPFKTAGIKKGMEAFKGKPRLSGEQV